MCPSHNGIRGRRRERSRSRSKSRGSRSQSRSREERRAEIRRRRTGWDTGTEKSTTPDVTTSLASFTGGIGFSTSGVPAVTQCNTLSSPSADTQGAQLSSNALAIAYQKRAMCRIYVGSLDYYLTVEEIKRVFQAFGTIVAVDMPKEGDRSKGFCFVEFSTPESAEMSLSAMQGFLLKGRSIKVGRPSAVGIPLPPAANLASVGLGTSSPSPVAVGGNSLVPSQAGALAAAAVLSSKANCTVDINAILQKSGASGITNLASLTSPQATTDPTVPSPSRIYVGNVPFSFTGADLEKIFNVFGKILSCYLLPNNENPGTHRGYGFIDFTEPSHAKLAIDTMNGFKVADKVLKVNYASSMRQSVGAMGQNLPGASPSPMAAWPGMGAFPTNTSPTSSIVGDSSFSSIPMGGPSPLSSSSPTASMLPPSATGANRTPLGVTTAMMEGGGMMMAKSPSLQQPPPLYGISPGNAFPGGFPPPMAPSPSVHPHQLMHMPPGMGGMPLYGGEGALMMGGGMPSFDGNRAAPSPSFMVNGIGSQTESEVILLTNMVAPEEVDEELRGEIQEECSTYGRVKKVVISIQGSDTLIFVAFETPAEAGRAIPQLHNRWFGGKQIVCHSYSSEEFATGNLHPL